MDVHPSFKTIQRFLRVIAGPLRLKTLFFLKDGEHCVCEIQKMLRVPQNLASYHLKVLRDAGLVSVRRAGAGMYYRVEKDTLKKYRQMFHETFGTDA